MIYFFVFAFLFLAAVLWLIGDDDLAICSLMISATFLFAVLIHLLLGVLV